MDIRNGYTQGHKNGTLKGSAITALAFGAVLGGKYLYQKYKDKKAIKILEQENAENKEKILNAFENDESVNNSESVQ